MNAPTPLAEQHDAVSSERGGAVGIAAPWWGVAVAAALYFGASELSLSLWLRASHTPALAMPIGVYLTAVLLLRGRGWALLGSLFLASMLSWVAGHAMPLGPCLGYFGLQSVAVFALAKWLQRKQRAPFSFETLRGVLVFAAATAVICACVLAPIEALSNRHLYGDPLLQSWAHWLFASLTALWLIVPPLVCLAEAWGRVRAALNWRTALEAILLFGSLSLAVACDFKASPRLGGAFLATPTVQLLWAIWAVLRFGSPGVGLAMLMICLGYVGATAHGLGPFMRPDRTIEVAMVRTLSYLAIWAGFFQIVAAILAERARAVEGLAALNRELERRVADRTVSLIKASEALQETESRLGMAAQAAHAGTFDWDPRSDANFWSDELLALYGQRREDFGGGYEDWLRVIIPEDRVSATNAVQLALRTGQYATHFRIRRGDTGELRWMEARGSVGFGDDGEALRLTGINVDVTEQKLAQQAVQENTARKSALLELTRAILAKPADLEALGQVVFAKIAPLLEAEVAFNFRYVPEKARLELVACLGLEEEQVAQVRKLSLNDAFRGTNAAAQTVVMVEKTPPPMPAKEPLVELTGVRAYACHPLLSSSGGLLGTLSFGSRRREEFSAQEVDFLQTVCHVMAMAWERFAAEEAMTRAKESAERASRAKDDFLAALSHELRTPLNPVLLLASELQQRAELPAEVRHDVATIRRNIELEARLIDDLLDLTRITRGKVSLDLQTVSVHRVLAAALEILRGEFAAGDLRLNLALESPRAAVQGDPVRLQQVFWNILRNAIKYTPAGGSVTVRTREIPGDRIEVEVSDTGQGINPANVEKIFDAFHQGEGRHHFGGLGLGLAIARSLVERHQGKIRASSGGLNRGATFTVELPLRGAELETESRDAAPAFELETLDRKSPGGLRILLVEDHEPTRSVLARLLERRQHQVHVAEDLAGARALAAREKFDLLISDLGLPDGDGAELMHHFIATGGPPGIAISGYGMEEDIRRSSHAGFSAHLVKPVDIGLLERTMAQLVDGKTGRN